MEIRNPEYPNGMTMRELVDVLVVDGHCYDCGRSGAHDGMCPVVFMLAAQAHIDSSSPSDTGQASLAASPGGSKSNVYDGMGGGSHGWDDNGTWFDRHVSTDRTRQLEFDLSEARRQLAEAREQFALTQAGSRIVAAINSGEMTADVTDEFVLGLTSLMVSWFENHGGVNVVEMRVRDPEKGEFVMTIRKKAGKTDGEIRSELQSQLKQSNELLSAVQEEGDCPAGDPLWLKTQECEVLRSQLADKKRESSDWYHHWERVLCKYNSAQRELDDTKAEVVLLRAERNAAREGLAEANTLLLGAALKYQESQDQLAEARKIVWGLIEHARAAHAVALNPGLHTPLAWATASFRALPRWLRKEIER